MSADRIKSCGELIDEHIGAVEGVLFDYISITITPVDADCHNECVIRAYDLGVNSSGNSPHLDALQELLFASNGILEEKYLRDARAAIAKAEVAR